ncbi:MAG TPA: hypothetical protein PKX63_08790, partial [Niabella sp.]|nr:hypothetical protein [Niabella sp.]
LYILKTIKNEQYFKKYTCNKLIISNNFDNIFYPSLYTLINFGFEVIKTGFPSYSFWTDQ